MSAAEPDRIAGITQVTTHGADAVAMLMRALRGKPKVLAILAACTRQVQALETAMWAVLTDTIDNGVGAQLDQIGQVLLEPRLALDDDAYRAVLKATVLARKSRGTAADLCAVLAAMLGVGPFTYAEGGAYVFLEPDGAIAFGGGAAIVPLRLAKAGGVRLELLDPAGELGKVFTFATGLLPETDADAGFGDASDPSVGGPLCGVRV